MRLTPLSTSSSRPNKALGGGGDGYAETCRTYIKDTKDSFEVRLPTDDFILIVPRMKIPRDPMPPALFNDLLLYFRDGPVLKNIVGRRTQSQQYR